MLYVLWIFPKLALKFQKLWPKFYRDSRFESDMLHEELQIYAREVCCEKKGRKSFKFVKILCECVQLTTCHVNWVSRVQLNISSLLKLICDPDWTMMNLSVFQQFKILQVRVSAFRQSRHFIFVLLESFWTKTSSRKLFTLGISKLVSKVQMIGFRICDAMVYFKLVLLIPIFRFYL